MKKSCLLLLMFLLLCLASPSFAITYHSDNFDNDATWSNWEQIFDGEWDFRISSSNPQDGTNYVLHGVAGQAETAANTSNAFPNFITTELKIVTKFGFNGGNTGLFFGANLVPGGNPSEPDDYNVHTVGISSHEDGNMYLSFDIHGSSDTVTVNLSAYDSSINVDSIFKLTVEVDDSDDIEWSVAKRVGDAETGFSFERFAAESFFIRDIPVLVGSVGVYTNGSASFGELTVQGTAVPVPGALVLLGSGIVGVAGLARRKN